MDKARTVDFKNAVIIMTSNIGSLFLQDPSLTYEEAKAKFKNWLANHSNRNLSIELMK